MPSRTHENKSDSNTLSNCCHVVEEPVANVSAPEVDKLRKGCCDICDYSGTSGWLCLHGNCLKIFCGNRHHDHIQDHIHKSGHAVAMHISTLRVWCYKCDAEVQPSNNIPLWPFGESVLSRVHRTRKKRTNSENSLRGTGASTPSLSNEQQRDSLIPNTQSEDTTTKSQTFRNAPMPTAHLFSCARPYYDRDQPSAVENDIELDSQEPVRGLTGLRNLGNTCYMNAALQALSNCEPLTEYFRTCYVPVSNTRSTPQLAVYYQRLVEELWSAKRLSYTTAHTVLYAIRSVYPMFRGYNQQDSQEFLRCFMDQLHEELKQPRFPWQTGDDASVGVDYQRRTSRQHSSSTSESASDEDMYATCDSGWSSEKETGTTSLSGGRGDGGSRHRRKRQHGTLSESATTASCAGADLAAAEAENFMDATDVSPTIIKRSLRPRVSAHSFCDSGTGSMSSRASLSRSAKFTGVGMKKEKGVNFSSKDAISWRSIVQDVFDGRILSSVQCLSCSSVSETKETFQDLSLPLPSSEQLHALRAQVESLGEAAGPSGGGDHSSRPPGWLSWFYGMFFGWIWGPEITLKDCLAYFFSSDDLKGDDMYSCDKCKKLRNGVKFCRLLALPEILCIHLKRFRHDFAYASKISTQVSFPLENLDMKPFLHKDCRNQQTLYNLVAVVTHFGSSGGGHYVCYALNPLNQRWYEYDDQCVTEVDASVVENTEAYVLFYRKSNESMSAVRRDVTELLRRTPLAASQLMKFYVSREWVNRFNTFAEPGPITNYDFLCPHGCIPPTKADFITDLYVAIPPVLWKYLYGKFGGGPVCSQLFHCLPCKKEHMQLRIRRQAEFNMYKQLSTQSAETCVQPALFAISMRFFHEWDDFVCDKQYEPPGPIDNACILAQKNGQAYLKPGADFAYVPEQIWTFFHTRYGGGPEIVHTMSGTGLPSLHINDKPGTFVANAAVASPSIKLRSLSSSSGLGSPTTVPRRSARLAGHAQESFTQGGDVDMKMEECQLPNAEDEPTEHVGDSKEPLEKDSEVATAVTGSEEAMDVTPGDDCEVNE